MLILTAGENIQKFSKKSTFLSKTKQFEGEFRGNGAKTRIIGSGSVLGNRRDDLRRELGKITVLPGELDVFVEEVEGAV